VPWDLLSIEYGFEVGGRHVPDLLEQPAVVEQVQYECGEFEQYNLVYEDRWGDFKRASPIPRSATTRCRYILTIAQRRQETVPVITTTSVLLRPE
jgi:hypothetical protein